MVSCQAGRESGAWQDGNKVFQLADSPFSFEVSKRQVAFRRVVIARSHTQVQALQHSVQCGDQANNRAGFQQMLEVVAVQQDAAVDADKGIAAQQCPLHDFRLNCQQAALAIGAAYPFRRVAGMRFDFLFEVGEGHLQTFGDSTANRGLVRAGVTGDYQVAVGKR